MFGISSLSFAPRILLLGLLVVGVLVKPVITFAGELHESEHAQLSGGHSHGDDIAPDPIDPADTESPWHALMHVGHCCSQTPALLPSMYMGSIAPTSTDPLPHWSVEFQPPTHPVALRPPIWA